MPTLTNAGSAAASATGAVLRTLVHGLSLARRPSKPMHPKGEVRQGRLFRRGGETPTGVEFLDAKQVDDVLVRESNGIGLPDGWPDIHGLAVRLDGEDGPVDLLFSTTGLGRWSRFMLTLSRTQEGAGMSTLFPYRSDLGPILLAARYLSPSSVELSYARGGEPWVPFADLLLSERQEDDSELAFDAVVNLPPGLQQYDAVRRLREPSYRIARETR